MRRAGPDDDKSQEYAQVELCLALEPFRARQAGSEPESVHSRAKTRFGDRTGNARDRQG
jgi:hypothetical protein